MIINNNRLCKSSSNFEWLKNDQKKNGKKPPASTCGGVSLDSPTEKPLSVGTSRSFKPGGRSCTFLGCRHGDTEIWRRFDSSYDSNDPPNENPRVTNLPLFFLFFFYGNPWSLASAKDTPNKKPNHLQHLTNGPALAGPKKPWGNANGFKGVPSVKITCSYWRLKSW